MRQLIGTLLLGTALTYVMTKEWLQSKASILMNETINANEARNRDRRDRNKR